MTCPSDLVAKEAHFTSFRVVPDSRLHCRERRGHRQGGAQRNTPFAALTARAAPRGISSPPMARCGVVARQSKRLTRVALPWWILVSKAYHGARYVGAARTTGEKNQGSSERRLTVFRWRPSTCSLQIRRCHSRVNGVKALGAQGSPSARPSTLFQRDDLGKSQMRRGTAKRP
jgi:hypothetical protein